MGKLRFRLKHRVTTLFRRVFRWRHSYRRMGSAGKSESNNPISIRRFLRWTSSLKKKAKSICSKTLGSGHENGYLHVGQDPFWESGGKVPKGYVTVYVGHKDGDFERVFVPVIYFNDPLFCELLKEAEEEYGYDHPGGITLPCPISEFENVQTRISRNRVTRKMFMHKQLCT